MMTEDYQFKTALVFLMRNMGQALVCF